MEGFRSTYRPHGSDRKIEIVKGNVYSQNQVYVSQPQSSDPSPPPPPPSATTTNVNNNNNVNRSTPATKSLSFYDAELKRRKRVAKYKGYAVEGKVKESLRRGLRWIKNMCSDIVHG
ncbi:PREDICTED: uncharacterized protein LOC104605179 [Nelumbo nucifera]|uniref:Uncharacterized protein LOC104605179 n=2 Tax=Nelumbo nucifera TaxID=4432 RepID=A0A1U8APL3_NELNU|nr:PREDICTED: uncharacterized protein LOC104605179 [Nelumbo nucifera]DAD33176.1 TPA_asm: hypothetical protein HUJ06_012027 [Nelumbo nucifera]